MQKTNPEMILSGELLDQALQLVKEDDPEDISGGCGRDLDQLTDQELESLVAERRDLLQAQEIEVEQSEKLLEGEEILRGFKLHLNTQEHITELPEIKPVVFNTYSEHSRAHSAHFASVFGNSVEFF